MRSKLSFEEAISTCFSQCYVSTLFIFVDRRPQDREKEKSKNRGEKEGPLSISGEQLPFTTGLRRSRHRTALPLPLPFLLLLRCLLRLLLSPLRFHRPSVHHRRVALPLPLLILLRLGCSPLFTLHVNSGE